MNYLAYNKLAGQVTDEKIQEILKKFEDRFPNMQLIDKSVTGLEVLNERLSDDDNVLLIGGDGTVNVFANEWNTTKVKGNWYIYSAGTGNDFLNDIEAQDGFGYLNPYMDNLPQVTANGITKYFVNNVGFGIDGDCCVVAEQNKAKGKINEKSELIIIPPRIRPITLLPDANSPISMTSATVTRLARKASPVIVQLFPPISIPSAAPKAAPDDAPRRSGAAMGF